MERKEFVSGQTSRAGLSPTIFKIIMFFITGTMTYSLVNPESFFGVLWFLVVFFFVYHIVSLLVAFLLGAVGIKFARR
ncbi:hypothetical protein [Psychrobacter sp. R86515]|uniref:hypothetical protein n=1 Tax=Psychrobacter sp. R86515 TaxID=3093855 RepID=UPI0036D391F8